MRGRRHTFPYCTFQEICTHADILDALGGCREESKEQEHADSFGWGSFYCWVKWQLSCIPLLEQRNYYPYVLGNMCTVDRRWMRSCRGSLGLWLLYWQQGGLFKDDTCWQWWRWSELEGCQAAHYVFGEADSFKSDGVGANGICRGLDLHGCLRA